MESVITHLFTGKPIPFDTKGVWPMQVAHHAPRATSYYATKVFHIYIATAAETRRGVWWAPQWHMGGHGYHGITGGASQETNAGTASQGLIAYMWLCLNMRNGMVIYSVHQ